MKKLIILLSLSLSTSLIAQDYGDFPKIEKDKLHRDLDILFQGLDKYHTGMYWYTSKDIVEQEFEKARVQINSDLDVLEFHKVIAPLVALSNEDHTDIYFNDFTNKLISTYATRFPLSVVFLGEEMYCNRNGSNVDSAIVGKKIISINGESPKQIVNKIGNLFASDGYINEVKYTDLKDFQFSRYYYYYYGNVSSFTVEFEDAIIQFEPQRIKDISKLLSQRSTNKKKTPRKETLEFKVISDSIAYLGIHDFDNDEIKKNEININLPLFLENSFKIIEKKGIVNVILDLTKNTGGSEGNEGLVYSFFGENYQKYIKVKAKTQKAILDNGIDKPITLKTFGFFERIFFNKKMKDGSYLRRPNVGEGLMAYKKEPKYKYKGNLYVLISPVTYSASSELSNMLFTNKHGTFIGQETGGGYYGNTSGYSQELILPHSKIIIKIPALQFMMNVDDTIPFGRGVIPHHSITPSFEQYANRVHASYEFALKLIANQQQLGQ